MMGYTHFPGGLVSGCLMALLMHEPTTAEVTLVVACGGFGGLLPDIDSPKSKISQMFPPIGFVMSRIFTHRGTTHTFLFWGLFFALLSFLFPELSLLFLAMFVGVGSHLLLDACTMKGCKMFQPFYKKKIRFSKIRTGSGTESFVTSFLYLVLCAMSYLLVQEQLGYQLVISIVPT